MSPSSPSSSLHPRRRTRQGTEFNKKAFLTSFVQLERELNRSSTSSSRATSRHHNKVVAISDRARKSVASAAPGRQAGPTTSSTPSTTTTTTLIITSTSTNNAHQPPACALVEESPALGLSPPSTVPPNFPPTVRTSKDGKQTTSKGPIKAPPPLQAVVVDKTTSEKPGAPPPPPPSPPPPTSFRELKVLLVPRGAQAGKSNDQQLSIFKDNLAARGARVLGKKGLDEATHVIVEHNLPLPALLKYFNVPSLPLHASYHTREWVVEGLKGSLNTKQEGHPCPPHLYRYMPAYQTHGGHGGGGDDKDKKRRKGRVDNEMGSTGSGSDEGGNRKDKKPRLRGGLACTLSGNPDAVNFNEHLTRFFEPLQEIYQVQGERFREFGYKKVIGILKALPFKVTITNYNVLKKYKYIGTSSIEKIADILKTGHCQRLDNLMKDPTVAAALDFCKIHGVGPKSAQKLAQTYHSIADLRARGQEDLRPVSRIALRRYEDLIQRIPRDEVLKIEDFVRGVLHRLLPGAEVTTCGSFRRGKSSCGDVDILIAPPRGVEEVDILGRLVKELEDMGFLTDSLTDKHLRAHRLHKPDTYMGICRLPNGGLHRRLDIKVYPRSMYATALLYFTGSDHFNRSMRYHAGKHGFRLSDKQLCRTSGAKTRLRCESEIEVFNHLGLPYKAPNERNCFDVEAIEQEHNAAKLKGALGYKEDDHDDRDGVDEEEEVMPLVDPHQPSEV